MYPLYPLGVFGQVQIQEFLELKSDLCSKNIYSLLIKGKLTEGSTDFLASRIQPALPYFKVLFFIPKQNSASLVYFYDENNFSQHLGCKNF